MPEPAASDGHPQVGSMHKNGDRMYGIAGPYARVLAARGTPKLSSLYHSTVTEELRSVRVGDTLRVEWDGTHWWASSPTGRVGRLTWSKGVRDGTAYAPDGRSPYDFDDGTLHVQTVTLDRAGTVVDCGGYVVPDEHDPADWPMTPMPNPRERKLRVETSTQPAPPTAVASAEPTDQPRSFLSRLFGRR